MKSLMVLPVLAVMAAHGAVTLDEGQTLELTQANAGNAGYADITLNGGTLRFCGDGAINYAGNVNGNGTVEKTGTGYARFENAGVIGSDSVVDVQAGALEVGAFSGEMRVADGATLNVGHRSVKAKALRLKILKTTSLLDEGKFQLSEIDLYLNGMRVAWPEGTTIDSTSECMDSSVSAYALIDRNGSSLGNRYFGRYNANAYIAFHFPEGAEVELDGYSLYSGNDCINGYTNGDGNMGNYRHPISWTMEYFDAVTEKWIMLDKQQQYLKLKGNNENEFVLTPGRGGTLATAVSGYTWKEYYKFHNISDDVCAGDASVFMGGDNAVMDIGIKMFSVSSIGGRGTIAIDDKSVFAVYGNDTDFAGVLNLKIG